LLIRNVVVTFSVAVAATLEIAAYGRSAAELRKPQLYQYIRGLSNNGPRKRADFQRKIASPAIYDDIEADIGHLLKKLMPARSDAVPNAALRCFRQTSSLVEGDPNVGTLPWMPSSRT